MLAGLLLAGCQNAAPETTREAADQTEQEKAQATSVINIEVTDGSKKNTPDAPPAEPPVIPAKKGLIITSAGIAPDALTAKVGETLAVYNSMDRQVDLYTTSDGSKSCDALGATIEIPGGESKNIPLEKAFSCSIINQENTDQKVVITVGK